MGVRRSLLFPVIGFLVGVAAGFGVLALKRYIANELIALLGDEARAACDCEFKVDRLEVSLLTLSAYAIKPRIEEHGVSKLTFRRLDGTFSLTKIWDRKILISELVLDDGFADGFNEQSVLYRYIDQLTAPVPPERDRPDRWKVKLQRLKIRRSGTRQAFSGGALEATGVSLEVQRTPENNFTLFAEADSVDVLHGAPQARKIALGRLSTNVLLLDEETRFEGVKLAQGESWLRARARSKIREHSALDGTFEYLASSQDTLIPAWLQFIIQGQGSLGGHLPSPSVKGSAELAPGAVLTCDAALEPPLRFTELSAHADLSVSPEGDIAAELSSFRASNAQTSVEFVEPLSLTNDALSGRVQITADSITTPSGSARGIALVLAIAGTISDPSLTIEGSIAALESGSLTLDAVTTSGRITPLEAQIELSRKGPAGGGAHAVMRFRAPTPFDYSLNAATLALNELALSPALTASGDVGIGFDGAKYRGAGTLALSSGATELVRGPLTISEKEIQLALTTPDARGELSAVVPLAGPAPGTIRGTLRDYSLAHSLGLEGCADISADLRYSFVRDEPLGGTGALVIRDLRLGCGAATVRLRSPAEFSIAHGAVSTTRAELYSGEGNLVVRGGVDLREGYTTDIDGSLDLETLLGLLPGIDDLEGIVTARARIRGPFESPLLTGQASLKDLSLASERAGIALERGKGEVKLDGARIELQNLQGELNGGSFSVHGELFPLAVERSNVVIALRDILLEPAENTAAVISGDLELNAKGLQQASARAVLAGELRIDEAEFQRQIDIATLIRALARLIFERKIAETRSGDLPPIELDIRIIAPRNLLVSTNWVSGEMKAELAALGTLNDPQIRGSLEILSGWFRWKDRRIEITSGEISFKPGTFEPTLSILGETYINALSGDSTLVFVEVRGPGTSPKIVLSSDRGLSQREILNLLSSRGSLSDQILLSAGRRSLLSDVENLNESMSDESIWTLIPRLLGDLTRLDSISIEPLYRARTGAIDPTAVAVKKLTRRLELRGESTLGAAESESSIGAYYRLLPSWTAMAELQESSWQQNTALEVNLVFSGVGKRQPFIDITVEGLQGIDRLDFLQGVRLHDASRLRITDLPALSEVIRRFLSDQGYPEATAAVECVRADEYCRALLISIAQGAEHRVSRIRLASVVPAEAPYSKSAREIAEQAIKTLSPGSRASVQQLQIARERIVRALRNEGFIGARVDATYRGMPEGSAQEVELVVEIKSNAPVTFVFQGATKFTPQEFFETINLFGRKQPFGNNTISILIENIEQRYRVAGYLYATIGYQKVIDPETERISYLIQIDEGPEVRVGEVRLITSDESSGQGLSTRELLRIIRKEYPGRLSSLLYPHHVVDEEIEDTKALISEIHSAQGYPDVAVSHRIVQIDEDRPDRVRIEYLIVSGAVRRFDHLSLTGVPDECTVAPLPQTPATTPQLNTYLEVLQEHLKQCGYLSAAISTRQEVVAGETNSGESFIIDVTPGSVTTVSEIHVIGVEGEERLLVESLLAIERGHPWDSAKIEESRRALGRRGLFTQIELEPHDGTLDSPEEALVVRVSRRPRFTFDAGGGLNSEYGLHLFGEALDRGLFSDGRTIALRLDGYYDIAIADVSQGVASIQYTDPTIFTEYLVTSDLRFQRLDQSNYEFNLNRVSLATYLHGVSEDLTAVTFGHTILNDYLYDVPEDAIIGTYDEGIVRASFLSGVVSYDQRDNVVNPGRGYTLSADGRFASEFLGSEANYYGLEGRASYLYPFFLGDLPFVFGIQTRVASSWTFAGTDEVPITQRYYLGGRSTIRGFRENSLGPRGEAGSVIGGDMLLANNIELRYRYSEYIDLLTFLDAGTVRLRQQDIEPEDIRSSVGLGFRYVSPIGPIGLDIGRPLDEKPGEPGYRVHFNIGSSF